MSLRSKIELYVPNAKYYTLNANPLYFVDKKAINKGHAEMLDTLPRSIPFISLTNSNKITVDFCAFSDNALIENGVPYRQCEGIAFPNSNTKNSWELFIELKYAKSIENAFNPKFRYPDNMIDQIIETVEFFRKLKILDNKKVFAIISFPEFEFSSASFFPQGKTPIQLLNQYQIEFRAVSMGRIINSNRIEI